MQKDARNGPGQATHPTHDDPAMRSAIGSTACAAGASDIQPDGLAALAEAFEQRLPEETARLAALAQGLQAAQLGTDQGVTELLRALHTLRGQAATFGYPLLGQIAGWLQDLLRRATRQPDATAPLAAETLRILQVGTGTLALVARHRLRGAGGEAGARILRELGGVVASLSERLDAAIDPCP